jgi:TolC family type I secretion outer membrane protein
MADGTSRRAPAGRAAAVASSLAVLLAAGPVPAQTLEEAMVDAYDTSPQLGAVQAGLRAVDERMPQALANYRPTARFVGEAGLAHLNASGDTLVGTNDDFSFFSREAYGLRLSQPIYRGGRTSAEIDGAMDAIQAERSKLIDTEQVVLLGAITDFMNIVADQTKVDLTAGYERDSAKYLDDTRGRLKFGAVTATDVSQAESAAARAKADRLTAEGALEVDRTIFQRDTGKAPGILAAPERHPLLPDSEETLLLLAGTQNPQVISAGYTERAAEDDVEVSDGALLPTFSIEGSIMHQSDAARFTTDSGSLVVGRAPITDYRIVGQLVIPLFDGGKSYSISRQARETVSVRQNELDLARRNAEDLAATAWEQLQAVRANIETVKQGIAANEAALDGVTHEASLGQRTVRDVLNAEEALFRSRLSLVDLERDVVVKEYTVAATTGQLTAKALGLPVDLYDPSAHFEAVRDQWFGFESDWSGHRTPLSDAAAPEPRSPQDASPTQWPPAPPASAAPPVVTASAAGAGGIVRYTRDTSIEDLPNEAMEYRRDVSLRADSDGFDERLERDRKKLAEESRAKWMEYGGDD